MAILCRDLNLLFIMVPATGCSVLGKVLREQFGGVQIPARDIVSGGRVVHPAKHNSVPQILRDKILTSEELANLTVAANVRNPHDRLVTYYQRMIGDWLDFQLEFMDREIERDRTEMSPEEHSERIASQDRRKRRQSLRRRVMRSIGFNPWFLTTVVRKAVAGSGFNRYLFPMLDGVHFGLRNEELETALNALLSRLGVDRTVSIPRKNLTHGKRHYTTYWNRLSRLVMDKLAGAELKRLGYTFEGYDHDAPLLELQPRELSTSIPPTCPTNRVVD